MGRLRSGTGPWGWEGGGGKENGEGGRGRGVRESRGRCADILRSLFRSPGSEAERRRKAGGEWFPSVWDGWALGRPWHPGSR